MAHKGQLWKLAFRRDFNLNVQTYTRGIGDAYLLSYDPGFPFIDLPPANTVWYLSQRTSTDVQSLSWMSEWLLHAGREWRTELLLQLTDDVPTGALWTFNLRGRTWGLVVSTINDAASLDSRWDRGTTRHVTYYDPVVWPIGYDGVGPDADPARYTDPTHTT